MIKVDVYFDEEYRYYDVHFFGLLIFRSKRRYHYDDNVHF